MHLDGFLAMWERKMMEDEKMEGYEHCSIASCRIFLGIRNLHNSVSNHHLRRYLDP